MGGTKFRGLSPLKPLVGDVSAKFLLIEECHVLSVTDPRGRNLGFLLR
jgi:hypothetical protein